MRDKDKDRRRYFITGVVQGVGFRPFVYSLATRLGLKGWVNNSSAGVTIEIEGMPETVDEFQQLLRNEAPPLATIENISSEQLPPNGFTQFEIRASQVEPDAYQPISPDISICEDCLRELYDTDDRRYRYPFINCTNCGPRFTIIKDIPYDRPTTTMAPFEMCPECTREYHDPLDRRFHAQPVACPVCGPKVWIMKIRDGIPVNTELTGDEAVVEAIEMLRQGKTVAIKGLGGFHLACDATNNEAVATLRIRKGRVDKPFALMMKDIKTIEQYCEVSLEERALLESRQRPIVLLWDRGEQPPVIADSVAPHQYTLGVMLPYTPLHYLLFADTDSVPLVMTSGNFSEEPIATGNDEAIHQLAPLADAFLLNDRDIHIRTDDSVVRVFQNTELPLRRSRGYAPYPVHLPFSVRNILAVGAELKNTFCLTREQHAFLSHHIGDMENLETMQSFEMGIQHFETLFRVKPEILAYDEHPNYMATRYALARAEEESLAAIGVQHHHSHIAACMAENGCSDEEEVIGVAFDGTGYGSDGAIWGGEFLICDFRMYHRAAHLDYIALPGGDAGTRKPARVAFAHLLKADIPLDNDLAPLSKLSEIEQGVLEKQINNNFNSPPTSSMGRLFDAVSSIAGVRHEINYEGQAAIELEAIADPDENSGYQFDIRLEDDRPYLIDSVPLIHSVVNDIRSGLHPGVISARFHNGVANLIYEVCLSLRKQYGVNKVALSGGVFQNVTLLARSVKLLESADFCAYTHHLVPPNDGGLALGQAMVAQFVYSRQGIQ
jgi:hydrogenase maturation protein HypF